MKPGICEKHGKQHFTTTSPDLCAAAEVHGMRNAIDIVTLRINSEGSAFDYYVDVGYLNAFGIYTEDKILVLKDRDKIARTLNDRLLIRKLMAGMQWACPACLLEITLESGMK